MAVTDALETCATNLYRLPETCAE